MSLWKRLFGADASTQKSDKPLSILPGVSPLKEDIQSFKANGGGDRDRLKEIIDRCTCATDGLSLLNLARGGIQPRWHALIKDLDTAIEHFPVKDATPVKEPTNDPIVWKGDNVPKQLRDDFIQFAMTPRSLNDLEILVRECKSYSDGKQLLKEVLALFEARYKAGFHSQLAAILESALKEWVPPNSRNQEGSDSRSLSARLRTGISHGKNNQWEMYFQSAQIHESLRSAFKSFVGSWPAEVDPTIFGGDAGNELVKRIHAFIEGPYPISWPGPKDLSPDYSPDYRVINGKITRASNPNQFTDMMICGALPRGIVSDLSKMHLVVLQMVETYSKLPLARLLFALPHIHLMSAAKSGRRPILVLKDSEAEMYRSLDTNQIVLIQIFKGVENAIFGAYDDIPEGGLLDEKVIVKTIRSLLPAS